MGYNIFRGLLLLAGGMVLFLPLAVAEPSPDQVMEQLVSELQTKGNELPFLDYADWETMYGRMTKGQRQSLGVWSPSDLKEHFRRVWTDPGLVIDEQIARQKKSLDQEAREKLEGMRDEMVQTSRERFAELNARYRRAKFKIRPASVSGESATVEVRSTIDNLPNSVRVPFIKRRATWRLAEIPLLLAFPQEADLPSDVPFESSTN